MKLKRLYGIFFSILTFTAPCFVHAQELHAEYQFFGFSDDLKYCAYEMFAYETDDSTPAFSAIYFIDVDKNDYAVRPIKIQDTLELDVIRKKALTQSEPLFKKYDIHKKLFGQRIEFPSEQTGFGLVYEPVQDFVINNKKYRLILSTVGTGQTDSFYGREEQMVIVEIESGGKKKALQPATKNPRSWGFVIGFQLLEAYWLQNKIAVFVEYQGPGFEGHPDRQQMIVTGILD